jgi:hypothetical protein
MSTRVDRESRGLGATSSAPRSGGTGGNRHPPNQWDPTRFALWDVVLQLLLLQELLLALARAAAAAQLLEALRQVRVQDLLQQLAQLLLAGARAAAAAQLLEALRQVRAQELLQQLARLLLAGAVQASRKPWLLPLALPLALPLDGGHAAPFGVFWVAF